MNGKERKTIGFSHAWQGLKTVFKQEKNFRIHVCAAFLVVIIGFLLQLSLTEWLVICLTIMTVLVTEVFNSAVEKTVDYISLNKHPSAKIIKDMAAGAVLIAAITAVIIGLLIFIPKLYAILS